jgi:uncharacterized membrane protein YjjP (DUF1212 family)
MHNEATFQNPEEQSFRDLLRRGDDFYRIGLFRNAREMYSKALESNIEHQTVQDKLNRCTSELKYTRNVVLILVAIAAVSIGIVMFS